MPVIPITESDLCCISHYLECPCLSVPSDSLLIGESPNICPFLKNNGHEAPKWPSAIIFQEWTDTRTFSYLKYTLIYNYV